MAEVSAVKEISIHALLAESDSEHTNNGSNANLDFYPRSPCGERHARRASRQQPAGISIHALLAESDNLAPNPKTKATEFLSTLSLRRATATLHHIFELLTISIHALLAESDVVDTVKFAGSVLFLSTLSLRRATAFIHSKHS